MRVPSLLAIALVLVAPTLTHADTILAGSDLTAINSGVGLCPRVSDCLNAAQQFTVFTSVVVDEIKVVVSAPYLLGSTDGSFNVTLGSQLGVGTEIGSGAIPINPKDMTSTQEEFDFTGLNLSLGAGTYFVEMTGANVLWDHAPALTTTPGTLGPSWVCDPTLGCVWQSLPSTEAVEIDGTAITPEPSTLALLGTGLLGFAEAARRKFLKG